MKLVEECEGIGDLEWRDEIFASVPYRLRRFQGMARSGLPVPGVHRIEGEIDLKSIPDPARLVDRDLTLKLEDGRVLRVALVDTQGRVLTEGHGPSRCSCC
jgi:hypothetical protein